MILVIEFNFNIICSPKLEITPSVFKVKQQLIMVKILDKRKSPSLFERTWIL